MSRAIKQQGINQPPPPGSGSGGGNVFGPASSIDGNLAKFSGLSGKIIADALIAATDVSSAVSLKHARSHSITSSSDHNPTGLTASQLLRLNAAGAAIESSGKLITDFDIAGAATTAQGNAIAAIATDSNLSTAAQNAVTIRHARAHDVDSASDHNASAAGNKGKFVKANSSTGAIELNTVDWPSLTSIPLSLMPNRYLPLAFRMGSGNGNGVYVGNDGTYVYCGLPGSDISAYCGFITPSDVFGYGTYKWTGRWTAPATHVYEIFGFIYHQYAINDGFIGFTNYQSTPEVECAAGGTYGTGGHATYTSLPGQDWTSDTLFQIIWQAGQVDFLINSSNVATITTDVPTMPMMHLMEVAADNIGVTNKMWMFEKLGTFQKTA